MIGRIATLAFGTAALSFAAAASAAMPAARPQLLVKLVECRAITDAAQRLACYDAQVSALDAAEKKKDVVVMDRAQVRETRKSLFGFTLPSLNLFSGGGGKADKDDAVDDITEIDSTVTAVRALQGAGWSLVLANGAGTWETSDPLTKDHPEVGAKIHIKKALVGSYLGSIGYNHGVRFRRVN
jgi:hypothetical protein